MENDAEFILYVATTIDGYIASSDGSIEWLTSLETNGEDNGYTTFYGTLYQAVPEQKLNLVKTKSYTSGAVEIYYKKR